MLFRDQHRRDTFKNVYRSIFDRRKAKPTLFSVFYGLARMHRKTLSWSDVVLVQTEVEARDLEDTYKVSFDWRKVPNGVGRAFLNRDSYANELGLTNYILCVGRIEPRKNQLSVIEAVKNFRGKHGLEVNLVLVGTKPGKQHFEYLRKFNKALEENPWIKYIEKVPYEKMPSLYHFAKVSVSASWFETTGLTSLEAVLSGCNAVAAGERAKEYLQDWASYCRPEDVKSIEEAIEKEYFSETRVIPAEMYSEYTWENAARKTREVYKEVLKA